MRKFFSDIGEELLGYYENLVIITPKILLALIVLFVVWLLARAIRGFTDRKLKLRMEDPLLAEFLATMVRSVIIILGLLVALRVLGLGGITTSILAGAGISAFIIGFALRDIGENFLAGILMAFKRPFRVGDFVETGAIKGRVIALSIRDTRLKTPDGKDVYVPNAMIIKNPLINYTIDGFLRYDVVVNLPFTADQDAVNEKIRLAVEKVEGVLRRRRKVSVFISGLSPGKVDVTVSFWIDTFTTKESAEKIRSQVINEIQKAIGRLEE
jgi:small conductance mechanosensitive channel